MPVGVRLQAQYFYIPSGAGGAALGQRQADWPGVGATPTPGPIAIAQSAQDMVFEVVPGGDSFSTGNLQTALNAAAADLYTQATTTNSVPGFTSGTLLALMQAWPTGGS